MSKPKKTGQRIGDWFLWIDCEITIASGYRKIPIVTVRKAISGGDELAVVVATKEMANELREAARQIDSVIDGLTPEGVAE